MSFKQTLAAGVALIIFGAITTTIPTASYAQAPAVNVTSNGIGGVVTSPRGPEAGVWVIAETGDLPTRFIRIVVTDDQGRYLIPDLPKAGYTVWVRGYGLVDSKKVQSEPGKRLNLTAVVAPTQKAAAEYYPAIYWYSMMKIPQKAQFPLGPVKTQEAWLNIVKTNGCVTCHQLGNSATRLIPTGLGHFENGAEAWERRIQSGQASGNMVNQIANLDTPTALNLFGDWTDRVAKGELPFAAPQRPTGVERNIVVTLWDWSNPKAYMHDEIASDRRNPTVNAYGPIYGATELSTDTIPVLDPVKNTTSTIKVGVIDPKTPTTKEDPIFAESPYWGEEAIWDSQTVIHNQMFDGKGRLWSTQRIRPADNPAFCKTGSDHPSAKYFPNTTSNRQLSYYDPKTQQFKLIDICFGTHHLQFDKNDVLWTSGGGQVIGWVDMKKLDATGDVAASQGWTPFIVDTNGNGKPDAWVEPTAAVDPTKDKRVVGSFYSVGPNPVDGSIWGSNNAYPGYFVRVAPGSNPPYTALTEIYEVPGQGGVRGADIDSKGVMWAGLANGQMASFDRSKCKGPLNGPEAASGKLCPEGWTLYPMPGPQFAGLNAPGSAEASYYTFVDQHNTLGLGRDVPIATGNLSESMLALVDGKWVQLRVPYPLGFFAKGMDGRIDDANAGWKGRGLWSSFGNRTPFHVEGGKGNLPKVLHFQVRANPLEG